MMKEKGTDAGIDVGSPQIIQIVGYKNTGKTTMTASLIAGLAAKGLKVAAVKHDGHDHFEMDQEGTDSDQFGHAGATAVAVMSPNRTAILKQEHTSLEDMLKEFSQYDWVVVEGFKQAAYPKLVMVRHEDDLKLLSQLQSVVGIVFWSPNLLEEAESRGDKSHSSFLFNDKQTIVEAVFQLNRLAGKEAGTMHAFNEDDDMI
ncbi:molybdopterin-guanine dinucleotide biosynthesis protein B [Paenibacillus sp. JGP012]|uniref:molybdopterin-guanine dinucleotide biosynthesis protein B n=1 Tax=Paenibacillus sp. JGP012 TaxID=2735914 RepID=UPI0016195D8C|nr:molybdopterin-guanine dinucleotide biosynthesis protein B [Paenibacillus sp. JGP012]MBB6021540.1 molybdopterin-guanine dinucleotide biosynthesis protein B [Paenibacillus sp. JGP012]